jgi:2-keto-4-pentenoate hydratase/2-oxohepta-3-ene-1,7-dioic acid hydratase in catechol pathway
MRICRYRLPGAPDARWGRVEDGAVLPWLPEGGPAADPPLPLEAVTLLAPLTGSRIFGIGRNYADHIAELNPGWTSRAPLVFMKPDSALAGPGEPIRLPAGAGRVDYEGELALVIGRAGRHIPEEHALEHLLGLTCANDVSARELQESDGQWIRAKGHDSFCPLGPWIVTDLDPADLGLRTWLNGRLVQDSRSSLMLRPPAALISFLSSFCTLRPGDLILSGTPAGVGPLQHGDRVRVEVEGVGALENPVEDEGPHAL